MYSITLMWTWYTWSIFLSICHYSVSIT